MRCVPWLNLEWMQIMSVGGNGRARQFFKQHGWSELGADKIEQKVLSLLSLVPYVTNVRWKSFMDCEPGKLSHQYAEALLPSAKREPPYLSGASCSHLSMRSGSNQTCITSEFPHDWEQTTGVSMRASQNCGCVLQYTSQAAQRYKLQLEKDAAKLSALPTPDSLESITPGPSPSAPTSTAAPASTETTAAPLAAAAATSNGREAQQENGGAEKAPAGASCCLLGLAAAAAALS